MKFNSRSARGLGVGLVAALGLVGCAADGVESSGGEDDVFTFTVATGALETTPHSPISNAYFDLVEEKSDGRIQFDRTSFEAICKMNEVVDCVRDGRADIGVTVPDYTPQYFPTSSIVGVSFMSTDVHATTAALYEMHTEYQPAVDLLEQNGLHYVANWPVGTLFIGSKEPVETMADLEGLKGRASGPVTQAVLQEAGMSINAITAAETYESLQRGVIDSVASALDFATGYKVNELLPYWTDPGLGQYSTFGMWWSSSAYDSLPDDLKAVVDEATAEFNNGTVAEVHHEATTAVCDEMLAATSVENVTRWDESATAEWRDEASAGADDLWVENAKSYGLDSAEEYLTEYQAAYEANLSDDNPSDGSAACVDRWQEQNG